jgi:hypothetical protein
MQLNWHTTFKPCRRVAVGPETVKLPQVRRATIADDLPSTKFVFHDKIRGITPFTITKQRRRRPTGVKRGLRGKAGEWPEL